MPRTTLRTTRLALIPMEPAHAGALWKAIDVSLPDLRPWLVWTSNATPEATAAFAAGSPPAWESGSAYSFVVAEGDDLIGTVGLSVHNPNLTQGEIGYWLRSDRAGSGFATEAARAVRDFAFDTAGRHRLNLRAGVANLASQRVAEKIGFSREGVLRAGGSGAEAHYDAYIYGMLSSDPRP